MVQNKPFHCLAGLAVAGMGCAGLVLGPKLLIWKSSCLLIFCAGWFWAIVIGHAPFIVMMIVSIPFVIASYFLRCPIRLRGGQAYANDILVIAHLVLPGRIVLVREFSDYFIALEGRSLVLPERIYRKAVERLQNSSSISTPVDEARLNEAIERWNADDDVGHAANAAPRIRGKQKNPLITLVADKQTVDYLHDIIELLWQRYRHTPSRGDVIQFAIWYALAVDKAYGHEKRGWFDHALLD